jgi:electron transport complex protein RnfG
MANSHFNYIKQAWLVIILSLLYGASLAGVQISLSGIIADNKRNETYNVIPDLVSGAVKEKIEEVTITDKNGKPIIVWKANNESGELIGWVVPASGQGFADTIELIVGINKTCDTITGIYVLNQKETPGLGDYITGKDFQSRFVAKTVTSPLKVARQETSEPDEIRALSGATISSQSVCDTVNKAMDNLREALIKASNP